MPNSDAATDSLPDSPPVSRPARKRTGGKQVSRPAAEAAEEYARLARQIRTGCEIVLPALDDAVMRLQRTEEESSRFADRIILIGSAGEIHFSDGTRLLRCLTGIDIGAESEDNEARWHWFQAALIGRLGSTPFPSIERISRTGKLPPSGSVTMRVDLRTASHAFSVSARATPLTWLHILAGSDWITDPRPESDYFGIPCNATVCIAHHTVPAKAMADLVAGDIFMPSSPRFATDGNGTIWLGGMAISVRYSAPGVLTITGMKGEMLLDEITFEEVAKRSSDGNHDVRDTAADEGSSIAGQRAEHDRVHSKHESISLSQIAVFESGLMSIDFELGRIAMSFGDARALHVGSVIEVAGGSTASIRIVCGGQILGCGEVVDVNGQLGIRVTQWSCQP